MTAPQQAVERDHAAEMAAPDLYRGIMRQAVRQRLMVLKEDRRLARIAGQQVRGIEAQIALCVRSITDEAAPIGWLQVQRERQAAGGSEMLS